jgi:tRNA 2-selenouridine synthase
MNSSSFSTFFNELDHLPLLDVRSPGEFAAGHIPGAVSFPLFTDLERVEVGTLYKQKGPERALSRGLEIVEPKKQSFVDQARDLGEELRVHCWRGGMRSARMVDWLRTNDIKCHLLEGGYKRYRKGIREFFEQSLDLHVLIGHTGSMKTEVLKELRDIGEQVIDLEGAANHEGSSFGNSKTTGQPSTEHFHNLVYEQARHFDIKKKIWIEDESYVIGKVSNIDALFNQKEKGKYILIEIPMSQRLDHLVQSYGSLSVEKLVAGCNGIRRRLGHERCDKAIELIREGNLRDAAEITLKYYDRQYQYSVDRKKELIKQEFVFEGQEPKEIAKLIYDRV